MSLTHIGRRKCAVALVRFVKGSGEFIINGKTGFSYLQQDPFAIQTVVAPLKLINLEKKYNIICSVRGGGICAQAEAIQLGVARALCSLTSSINLSTPPVSALPSAKSPQSNLQPHLNQSSNDTFLDKKPTMTANKEKVTTHQGARPLLKEQGYLRRDSRIKERRKYGLKKARKAEQYSKR